MDNICYLCNQNPGIDCPGRKPDERTKCQSCLDKYMAVCWIDTAIHQLSIMKKEIEFGTGLDGAKSLVSVFEALSDKRKWEFYMSLLESNNEKKYNSLSRS